MAVQSIYEYYSNPLAYLDDIIDPEIKVSPFPFENPKYNIHRKGKSVYMPVLSGRHAELSARIKSPKSYKLYDEDSGASFTMPTTTGWRDEDDFSVRLSYRFSSARRIPKVLSKTGKTVKYGSNLPFDNLYRKIVVMNYGVDFVMEYLENIDSTPFGASIQRVTNKLYEAQQESIAEVIAKARKTKSGNIDRRTRESNYINNFRMWQNDEVRQELDNISWQIKRDIQRRLSTGQIRLHKNRLSKFTAKRREALGLTPLTVFYATGQLIDNLIVKYEVKAGV